MPSRHLLRVASHLKFLIATVLQRDLRDPRVGFVTVLEVEPTADYKEAKVTVSVLGSPGDRSKALHALEDSRGFIQKKIGKQLRLRRIPTLRFVLDESQERQGRFDEVLDTARREREGAPTGGDEGGLEDAIPDGALPERTAPDDTVAGHPEAPAD